MIAADDLTPADWALADHWHTQLIAAVNGVRCGVITLAHHARLASVLAQRPSNAALMIHPAVLALADAALAWVEQEARRARCGHLCWQFEDRGLYRRALHAAAMTPPTAYAWQDRKDFA